MRATAKDAGMDSNVFRSILARSGLTIREAAARLGVGCATVSRWQTGVTPIAESRAKLIRAVLRSDKKTQEN